MNFLVIATFAACFLAEYFVRKLNLFGSYFVLLPELLAGIALLVVLGRLIVGKRLQLDARYLLFLALLVLTMATGAVVQNVPPGAIISGLRDYFPFLPLFLLGAVYPFTERQIRSQLNVLALLLAIQVPLAVYQRFFSFADRMHTGDVVTGTVTNSGLSILMIAGITVLTVLYLRRRLSLPILIAAAAFLLLPTTLNETKATLIMLPIAVLAPLFFMRGAEKPLRRLLPLVAVFAVSGGVFISVYNTLLQEYRDPEGSIQQFWLEGGLQNYVYKGSLEGDDRVGRLDSLQFAVRGISETPLTAAFGLGIGNVSPALIPGFHGDYASYYDVYKVSFTQLSMLLWNMGYIGVAVFGLFFFAMFRDALLLARSQGPFAGLGQAWGPIVIIAMMCVFYIPILTMKELVYPLMFYAGILARSAFVLRREQRAQRQARTRVSEYDWRPTSSLAR